MIVRCVCCNKSFDDGEKRDEMGRFIVAGKKICSPECMIIQGKKWSKRNRESKWFSLNRDIALERDGYKCCKCGSLERLVVHHIDGNGRGSKNPNNDLSNLQTLCHTCHQQIHVKIPRDRIYEYIKNNPNATTREIGAALGISHMTAGSAKRELGPIER